MWQIDKRVHIPQSPEKVFDYLAQFDNIREWDPSVLSARPLSPGAPEVGSRFRLVLLFGLSRVPMVYEITALEPGRELVLEGRAASFTAVDRISFDVLPGKIGYTLKQSLQIRYFQIKQPSGNRKPFPFQVADRPMHPIEIGSFRFDLFKYGRWHERFQRLFITGFPERNRRFHESDDPVAALDLALFS